MTATLAHYIFFIQSPLLTNFVGLNSNSNLVSMTKISMANFFVVIILECICSLKYGASFIIARSFFDTRIFIHDFLKFVKFVYNSNIT